jgi:excisionase family DNA binding protein
MRKKKLENEIDESKKEILREIEDEFKAKTEGLEKSPTLYTIEEASEILGISENEMIRLIHLKRLPSIRVGKHIRLRKEDVDDFFERIGLEEEVPSAPILYTAEQVAKILQLSVDNVWKLLKSGKLKGFQIRNGIRSPWRIPKDSLDEYIQRRMDKKEQEIQTGKSN